MAEFLTRVVRRKTLLDERTLDQADVAAIDVFLDDWTRAHTHLGEQIEALRRAREQRLAHQGAS